MRDDMVMFGKLYPFSKRGFILPLTILLILGVTAIAVGTIFNSSMGRFTAQNYKNKIRTFSASDGLMTLLTQEALDGNGAKYIDTTHTGKIYGQVWNYDGGLADSTIAGLKAHIASQPTPDRRDSSTYLGSNWNADNYGVLWTGWLMPPVSGAYTFYVRADQSANFLLGPDADSNNLPANSRALCSLSRPSTVWPTSGSGVSKPVYLNSDESYFFRFYHREKTGSDMGQVGWIGPEWFNEMPVIHSRLSNRAPDTDFASTVNVGTIPVRYRIASMGFDQYGIFTEAVITKPGSLKDTSFRAPLDNVLSTRGTPVKPPDTVYIPVIYYDYHTDGSNPEFQGTWLPGRPPKYPLVHHLHPYINKGKVRPNMVMKHQLRYMKSPALPASHLTHFGLDSIPKPIKNPARTKVTYWVDKWFQPWTSGTFKDLIYDSTSVASWPVSCSAGDTLACLDTANNYFYYRPTTLSTKSRYDLDSLDNLGLPTTVAWDTAEKSLTFLDSLPFARQADGSYKYSRSNTYDGAGNMFFPLDGKGFGADNPTFPLHNYSFCMEMHIPFVHRSGMNFNFTGDDDIWVFIGDSLVIDMGSNHPEDSAAVSLDDLPLEFGNSYRIDVFYCERNYDKSNIRVITNLPVMRPKGNPVASWKRNYGNMN